MSKYYYALKDFSTGDCEEKPLSGETEIPLIVQINDFDADANYEMGLVEVGYTQTWDQLAEETVGFHMKFNAQVVDIPGFKMWEFMPHNAIALAEVLNQQIKRVFSEVVKKLLSDWPQDYTDYYSPPQIEIVRGQCKLVVRSGHILTHPLTINFSEKIARLLGVQKSALIEPIGELSSWPEALQAAALNAHSNGTLLSGFGWAIPIETKKLCGEDIQALRHHIEDAAFHIRRSEYTTGYPDMQQGTRYIRASCNALQKSYWWFSTAGIQNSHGEVKDTLRVFKMPESRFGKYVHVQFPTIHYNLIDKRKVGLKGLIAANINFFNDNGDEIQFKFGKVIVVLHIRKVT